MITATQAEPEGWILAAGDRDRAAVKHSAPRSGNTPAQKI
jgi:hypothetical protein